MIKIIIYKCEIFILFIVSDKEEWYQSKLSEYSSSFTIHGLSRTIHTDSHVERLFWVLSLLLAVGIAFLMVSSLFWKFWSNDVYWSIESKVTNKGENIIILIIINKITGSFIFK